MIKITFYKSVLFMTLVLPTVSFGQQQFTFGRFKSRALFTQSDSSSCPAPLVILVPGSGANGPEEMMPGALTGNSQDHSIFASFSHGLQKGHVNTLAIGKPGVEFFTSWDRQNFFYDVSLYQELRWQDLINNLSDAVQFARTLPCVDVNKISVLGHSEGTQVAIDYASSEPSSVTSLILVGFAGENLATTVDWQLFRRPIDSFLKTDVDHNHDGFISYTEAQTWPEFVWHWSSTADQVSYAEIETTLRANATLKDQFQKMSSAKVWQGVFSRDPIYIQAANLKQRLLIFTGELDVQTRPEEALKMGDRCNAVKKVDCEVTIVPGLGHAMSRPKGPRGQKLVDLTLGPVDESFLNLLMATALQL